MVLASAAAGAGVHFLLTQDTPKDALRAALSALTDNAAAGELGQRYLNATPHEGEVSLLLDQLAAVVGTESAIEGMVAALRGQIEREFLDGDIVDAGGWVLARTEARLYALIALA
jgi:hypothetical protein